MVDLLIGGVLYDINQGKKKEKKKIIQKIKEKLGYSDFSQDIKSDKFCILRC